MCLWYLFESETYIGLRQYARVSSATEVHSSAARTLILEAAGDPRLSYSALAPK
jgi:hypothetical protein